MGSIARQDVSIPTCCRAWGLAEIEDRLFPYGRRHIADTNDRQTVWCKFTGTMVPRAAVSAGGMEWLVEERLGAKTSAERPVS